MAPSQYKFQMAIQDFQSARRKAAVQEILARITGKSTQLLSYDEVAAKLRLHVRTERGIQNIPVDAIVGSVGRYTDFTRTFLPRHAVEPQRWAGVRAAFLEDGAGLPPIEVYKVGEAYFVIDGNHRVSIAKREKFQSIAARVIEVKTDMPLTPDIQPDELIIKAEYAKFLAATRIMDLRPNVDLDVTIPGQYDKLMSEIYMQRFLFEEEHNSDISPQDAVESWYDNTYIPLVETIRDRGLLHWFPNRTLTDLYVWISENRATLAKELGWGIQSDITATDLILKKSVTSEPGIWRKARTATRYTDRLFTDILIPLSGEPESWDSLEQAIITAQREGARLHGLHIVESQGKVESPYALAVQTQFEQACLDANVEGKLVIESGDITKKVCERATMTDLVVLKIAHPPMAGVATLRSPFRAIIMNSSRPVLGVPAKATHFQRALLAYDGNDRAREALFVATYLAEIWKTQLIIFTALDGTGVKADAQDYVHRYLDIHEVEAEYHLGERGAMTYLRRTVEERAVDLVLMGSYGGSTVRQVFVGSALDYMLRESTTPIFICR